MSVSIKIQRDFVFGWTEINKLILKLFGKIKGHSLKEAFNKERQGENLTCQLMRLW